MRSGISELTIIDFGVGVKNDRKIAEWVIGLSRNQRSYNPEMGGRNAPKYAGVNVNKSAGVDLSILSSNKKADYLFTRLGDMAINENTEQLYRYDGTIWNEFSDRQIKREIIDIFQEQGCDFSDRTINSMLSMIKMMLLPLSNINTNVISFRNGVYDIRNNLFREHSSLDGLLTHNNINYLSPKEFISLEISAPYFYKWIDFVSNSDENTIKRIMAGLYMVLANRYDWQFFLEITGEGGSGKSVFSQILILLAGGFNNVASASMSSLDQGGSTLC